MSAADEEAGGVTARKGAGPGVVLMAAMVAAGIAGAFAWVAKPAPPPRAATAREAALDLVGRWNEVGLGDCAANALVVSVEPGGLALSFGQTRDGRGIIGLDQGWVRLGDGGMVRRDGANLKVKSGSDAAEAEYTPCT